MDSLEIGKVLIAAIQSDEAHSSQLGGRVFPLVAEEGTAFPFAIYRRSSLLLSSTKDGLSEGTAYVEIAIATERYGDGITIAKRVKDILSSTRGVYSGIDVDDISLTDSSEEYAANAFVQNLTFKFIIYEQD